RPGQPTLVLRNDIDRVHAQLGVSSLGLAAGPGADRTLRVLTGLYPDRVKSTWRIAAPLRARADARQVDDLLNKLSGLFARDKDARATARLTTTAGLISLAGLPGGALAGAALLGAQKSLDYGFEKPWATVTVTVSEEVKVDDEVKGRRERTHTLILGTHDAE